MFKLNEKENETLFELRHKILDIFGDASIISETYMFTDTGIGSVIEVKFKIKHENSSIEIIKNITDFYSW